MADTAWFSTGILSSFLLGSDFSCFPSFPCSSGDLVPARRRGFWERLFFRSPASSSSRLCKDVMPGVTAAILGHEATNIKAKGPHVEDEGLEGEKEPGASPPRLLLLKVKMSYQTNLRVRLLAKCTINVILG